MAETLLDEPMPEAEVIPETEKVTYDDFGDNFAAELALTPAGRLELKRISAIVRRNYQKDWEGQADWRKTCTRLLELFSGKLPAKEFPWKDAANAHVPILIENIGRLQSRLMAEIFGDFTNVVGVMPVTQQANEMADVQSKHDNYQLRNEIPDFERQMERAMLTFLLFGDFIVASEFDEELEQNRHETLMPEEFALPYSFVSTMADLSDLPRFTRIRRMYAHQIEALKGRWFEVDRLLRKRPPAWSDEPETETRDAMGKLVGQDSPEDDDENPYVILEYYGWFKAPGADEHRWCKARVDNASGHVLWFSVHEEEDWKDAQRFEREMQEAEIYQSLQGQRESELDARRLENKLAGAALDQSIEEGVPAQEGAMQQAMMEEPEIPEPERPAWAVTGTVVPKPPKRRKVSMFAHGVCLENLVGATGLGVGGILADYNAAADTALSQFTDACTLANCWTIVTTNGVELKGHEWRPGTVTKLEGSYSQNARDSIIELRPGPANSQLTEIVDRMSNYAQSAAQAPNVLSGDPGKSGETFRGISARIEQATKQLGIYGRRFVRGLLQVCKNNAKLNAVYLPEVKPFIIGSDALAGAPPAKVFEVRRDMYRADYRVEIRADLKFTSEAQRISEADQLVQMPAAVPPLQQNLAFQHETVRKALAARGEWGLVALLGQAPQPPPTFGMPSPPPPGMMPPGMPPGAPPGQGPPQGPPPGAPNG